MTPLVRQFALLGFTFASAGGLASPDAGRHCDCRDPAPRRTGAGAHDLP
jgi:hypothetical protein